jgi:hypothetical protein
MGWVPAQETSGSQWMPRFLAESLVDPYASVRYLAQRALKSAPGFRDFQYDYIAPLAQRAQARQHALDLWNGRTNIAESGSTLRQSDPLLQEDKVRALIQQRDNRRMELLE